jgi:hypothetical protein
MRRNTAKCQRVVPAQSCERTYLIDSVCLVVVDDAYLARIGKIQHVGLLDVDNILDGEGDLDAVTVVVRAEDDPLEALHPLLGTLGTVGSKVIGAVVGGDGKVDALFVLVCDGRRDAVSQVDLALGEVEVLGIAVVRHDIALEAEPVAVVLGVSFAALGQVARLGDLVLW